MRDTEQIHSTQLGLDKMRSSTYEIAENLKREPDQQQNVQQVHTLEQLQRIVENVTRISNTEQRLQVLLQAALQQIPTAQQGTLYLSTDQSHIFVIGAVFPAESERIGAKVDAKGGYIEAVSEIQNPVLLPDVQNEDLFAHRTEGERTQVIQSALIAPFIVGGKTIGVLCLENCDERDAFTQAHQEFATLFSHHTAMAVDNARLLTVKPTHTIQEPSTYRALADRLPIGILVVASSWQQSWANDAFYAMTGYTESELVQGALETCSMFSQGFEDLVQKTASTQELMLTCRDRTLGPVRAAFFRLDTIGITNVEGYVGVFQDLREKTALERQVFHMQRLSNLGTLMSGVAHELNNPITAVLGLAELLLMKECTPQESRQDLETIVKQAEQSMSVVRELLDYVHPKIEEKRIDLNDLIRQVTHFRTCALNPQGLNITLNLEESTPLLVGDARQLQQVILNLINNAEQAACSANRTPRLWIKTRPIKDATYIRVSVRDNGPGIPPQVQQHIFEPFFTTKPPGEGTGLGLNICKQIVSRHRGRIWLESEPGQGATFFIDLPIHPNCETDRGERSSMDAEQTSNTTAHVLVVDDERSIGHLIERVLAKQGHRVDNAWNGEEALQKLQRHAYDMVFLDLKIPGLSGQDVYTWLKKNRAELVQRTVILTGDILGNDTIDFLEQEPVAYLLKPFQLAELRTIVNKVWTR